MFLGIIFPFLCDVIDSHGNGDAIIVLPGEKIEFIVNKIISLLNITENTHEVHHYENAEESKNGDEERYDVIKNTVEDEKRSRSVEISKQNFRKLK